MLALITSLSVAAAPALFTVQGNALAVHPWCGGAMPSPEQRERRAPDTQQYVVKPGERNSDAKPVATITPGADGRFSVKLPAGKWCVVSKDRSPVKPSVAAKQPPPPGTARAASVGTPDFVCLDGVWAECELLLDVGAEPSEPVTLTRYVPCSWHVRCPPKGALPPAPPP